MSFVEALDSNSHYTLQLLINHRNLSLSSILSLPRLPYGPSMVALTPLHLFGAFAVIETSHLPIWTVTAWNTALLLFLKVHLFV